MPLLDLSIVVVAAGSSTRMGFDKVWADLCGRPLLAWSVEAARRAEPAEVIVVVASQRVDDARALLPGVRVVSGGARRRDSVAAGARAASSAWLAIHDAARALVPPELFRAGLQAARETGCAIPVVPLKDTIKRVTGNRVAGTIDRAAHVAVQTPQLFRRDLLLRALASTQDDVTDEAALVEHLGVPVAVFAGDERNFKLTTPLDFALARLLAAEQPV